MANSDLWLGSLLKYLCLFMHAKCIAYHQLFPNKEFLQVLYPSGGPWLEKKKMFVKEIWHDFAGISMVRKRGEIENLNSLLSRVSGFYVCWAKHDLLEVLVLLASVVLSGIQFHIRSLQYGIKPRFLNRIIGSTPKILSRNPKPNETEGSTKTWKALQETSKLSALIIKTMHNFFFVWSMKYVLN